ncbi:hypothetical protein RF11_02671 [Thelohanellus kitauei]|uniref:Uncharacterized protein n=1 Tax=Thelohanellus kitauei TaxID=669202 RepID=A0A0C2N3Q2_THEKT|nr:hypothetical protein RF11_02671 [Thelohanellus kitauei]
MPLSVAKAGSVDKEVNWLEYRIGDILFDEPPTELADAMREGENSKLLLSRLMFYTRIYYVRFGGIREFLKYYNVALRHILLYSRVRNLKLKYGRDLVVLMDNVVNELTIVQTIDAHLCDRLVTHGRLPTAGDRELSGPLGRSTLHPHNYEA